MQKGQPIGQGRTAEIFEWGGGKALKLYFDWVPEAWVNLEARVTKTVFDAGIPAPQMYDIVEFEGRLGIVLERVEGPSMLDCFIGQPWKLWIFANLFAELHAKIHSCKVEGLSSQHERLAKTIREGELSDDTKEAALKVLAELPQGQSLCHFDFHPGNVIMTRRGPVIIDWMAATQGNPLSDVARTLLLLELGSPPPGTRGKRLLDLARSLFVSTYMKRYLELRRVSRSEIDGWRLPVAAARLWEKIPQERDRLLEIIENLKGEAC